MQENTNLKSDRHILLFDKSVKTKGDSNVVLMQEEVLVLGRQSSSDIPLRYDFVSRQHATFMRFQDEKTGDTKYQIVDGGNSGRSTNGIKVNNKNCLTQVLSHGDTIKIGDMLNFIYVNVSLNAYELRKYIDIISRQHFIDETTGEEISMVTQMFHSYSDTVLHTKLLAKKG